VPLLKEHPRVLEGVVFEISNKRLRIFVPEFGISDYVPLPSRCKAKKGSDGSIEITWTNPDKKAAEQTMKSTIRMFQIVPVSIQVKPDTIPCETCIVLLNNFEHEF